jgi:hypothetical protein
MLGEVLALGGDVEGIANHWSYLPCRKDPFKALREGAFHPIRIFELSII